MNTKAQNILNELFSAYPALGGCKDDITRAAQLILECAKSRALIMICGNGGSAADSEHIVGELMKGFLLRRPLSEAEKERFGAENGFIAEKLQKAIRAVSLTSQQGLISAFSNDVDASLVYAQQVYAYAVNKNDVLIALSTSGNSKNVVNAAKTANAAGIKSIAITGEKQSALSESCTVCVRLPSCETYKIQELTLPVYHALCAAAEAELFSE